MLTLYCVSSSVKFASMLCAKDVIDIAECRKSLSINVVSYLQFMVLSISVFPQCLLVSKLFLLSELGCDDSMFVV